MKILFLEIDTEREWALASVGPAYIASYIRLHGHEAAFLRVRPEEEIHDLIASIEKEAPDILGFSLTTSGLLLARVEEEPEVITALIPKEAEEMEKMTLAVRVTPGLAEFFMNGEPAGEYRFAKDELLGKVGLFVQKTEAVFSEVRVRY